MKIFVDIYALIDPRTDEIRYVGKSRDAEKRKKEHIHDNLNRTHKERWLNELKKLNLTPNLVVLDSVLEDDWRFWEIWWIQILKSWNCNLTNIGIGGEGGNNTPETRQKISLKNKGNKYRLGKTFNAEQRARMSNSLKGRKLSKQHIENKAKGCFKHIDIELLKILYTQTKNYNKIGQQLNVSGSKIYRTLKILQII